MTFGWWIVTLLCAAFGGLLVLSHSDGSSQVWMGLLTIAMASHLAGLLEGIRNGEKDRKERAG